MRFRVSDNLVIDTDRDVVRRQGLRIAIIGESGSGKSWLMAVIAEQAIQQGLQVVVYDVHGEYWTFAEIFENFLVIGGDNADLPLSVEGIDVYAEAYRQGFSLDFNFREYLADEYEYGILVEKILRKLWKIQVNSPRPTLWILEEAHLIAPQEKTREVMRRVGLIKAIATGGRKFGILLILGTQRPAELHKTPLSQCYIRFFGKLTDLLDRKAVEDYLKPYKSDILKVLKTGEFYVYGWLDEPKLITVTSKRVTRHGAETPLVKPIERGMKVKKSVEQLRKMFEEALRKKREEMSERARLLAEIDALKKQLEEERKAKAILEEKISKLEMELDILSRVKGVNKLAIEQAIMEIKELKLPKPVASLTAVKTDKVVEKLKEKIRILEEENKRLRSTIEKYRRESTPILLTPIEEKRIKEWVLNFKKRLEDYARNPTRKRILKTVISIDPGKEFFPEFIAGEVGVSSMWVAQCLKELHSMFKVGLLLEDGKEYTTSLVETRKLSRGRRVFRNNIRKYVISCLRMLVPTLPDLKANEVLNQVLSYIYAL